MAQFLLVRPTDIVMATDDAIFYYATQAIEWLNPIVYLFGLGIALWAFRRCRKRGYLVVAIYFALAVFSLLALPSINRAIRVHQYMQDYDAQTRQQMDAAAQDAMQKVLVQEGHPEGIPNVRTIHFPFGPILLVVGLLLVAKHDTCRPDTAHESSP
jgi:hypothetical protein